MKKNKLAVVLYVSALGLSGCGMIDNSMRSDDSIKLKAAKALNTTADKITIENRTASLGSVSFEAIENGKTNYCYYSTAGVTSDVVCSDKKKTESKPSTTSSNSCNALQAAAGQC